MTLFDYHGFHFQSETDWVKFIKPCLDVIEKISNLLPEESFASCVRISLIYFYLVLFVCSFIQFICYIVILLYYICYLLYSELKG